MDASNRRVVEPQPMTEMSFLDGADRIEAMPNELENMKLCDVGYIACDSIRRNQPHRASSAAESIANADSIHIGHSDSHPIGENFPKQQPDRGKRFVHRGLTLMLFLTTITFFALYLKESNSSRTFGVGEASKIEALPFLTIMHTSDVSELKPFGDETDPLSRLEAFKASLLSTYKLAVFAGNLLHLESPMSIIRGASDDDVADAPIASKQMIDIGNEVLDIALLGEDELSQPLSTLKARLRESTFPWLRTNVSASGNGMPHPHAELGFFHDLDERGNTKRYKVFQYTLNTMEVSDIRMVELRVAVIGIAPTRQKAAVLRKESNVDSILVGDVASTIRALPAVLREIKFSCRVHLIVAVTHLDLVDEIQLANANLDIDLILSGTSEHSMSYRTASGVYITRADAQLRSVFLHQIYLYTHNTPEERVYTNLGQENVTIKRDEEVLIAIRRTVRELPNRKPRTSILSSKVKRWWEIAEKRFTALGYSNIHQKLYKLKATWDLRTAWISTHVRTLEGALFADAIYECGVSHFGMGSVNLEMDDDDDDDDDVVRMSLIASGVTSLNTFLEPTWLTPYDVFRIFPRIGDEIVIARVRGEHLRAILQASVDRKVGSGAFLLWSSNLTCPSPIDMSLCTLATFPLSERTMYRFYTHASFLRSAESPIDPALREHIEMTASRNSKDQPIHFQRCMINYLEKLATSDEKTTTTTT